MANLRINSITIVDSAHISASFTDALFQGIDVENVVITSQTPGVPDSNVLSVDVTTNVLNITCQPLTPLAAYYITFQSTSTIIFKSLNGQSVLFVDGVTNRELILGPLESDNPIQEYLTNFYRENVYDLENPSIVSSYIQGMSTVLSKVLYDIRQSKNENYLSFSVIDEAQVRSGGPFDRLNEEGAYEVTRVGINRTGALAQNITSVSEFPIYPVSLLSTSHEEFLTINSEDIVGSFNLNSFILNLSEQNIIIVNSVIFIYGSSASYTYNINTLGYQISDSKYDPDFAFTLVGLSTNQIKLSEKVLDDPDFSLDNIIKIQVSYQFKDTGKIIDNTTLVVDTVLPSGREVLPPLENIFTLSHAPIVNSSDAAGSIGDVVFTDPNALVGLNQLHPAFLYEIVFRLDRLPANPGEYSVDYSTGNVYVYGKDLTQDGTGPFPPLASYSYQLTFKSEIDYVFDSDSSDLVSLPNGSLVNSSANIIYNYEKVLAKGIDYNADVHIEALNERIQNRLVALNAIQPLNFPITNVFRIYNETTGEIYQILRWTNSQIIFNYNQAPNIETEIGERASFQVIPNEILFVSGSTSSGPSNIFKILLDNNNIIGSSEDVIGSSFNTSVNFSNANIFQQEIYFDNFLTEQENNSRLTQNGYYQIDYVDGVVYCLVPSAQDFSIGSASYKRGYINPAFPHVISINDIYYQINTLSQKNKTFSYISFSDGSILPSSFDVADESFFNGDKTLPYQVIGGQIGEFINSIFTPGVSNTVKFIRSLFSHDDLLNNIQPINFASASTPNGKTITLSPLVFNEYHNVEFDGTNHYILANTSLLYQSSSINFNFAITRLTGSASLSVSSIVLGNPFKLILSGAHSPTIGDPILLTYTYTVIGGSTMVVDYNKGDYYIDYSYLADEILISYEYGDNVLDFRQSNALSEGDSYFVSYKVGALRDALLKNFGSLINIPILNTLDVSFERERYRDALMAAMQSFTAGPTLSSMNNIVNTIVHTPPEIIESAFRSWALGTSLLNQEPIKTTGNFSLLPAKYDNGVLVNTAGQSITFPISSNLRLEQGTLGTWIVPDWNGLDNQSDVTFSITKNAIPVLEQEIFIGPSGYHPTYDGYSFTLNTSDNVLGIPNESKNGVFIYYSKDISGNFNRWYVDVFNDGYYNGHFDGYSAKDYKINMSSNGKFYDVKSLNTNDGYEISQNLTFLADNQHYIFDFGKDIKSNRFSLFKDEGGYLNFRVIDKFGTNYILSSDISSWQSGQLHYVATSWVLNTKSGQDELHLFIDGFEVPNIIKYGNKTYPYLHENFRTVDPEEIVGEITNGVVSSTDLVTTATSYVVSSSLSFNDYGIVAGGTLYVEEPGFNPLGYAIGSVNGNSLTLLSPMPISINGAMFSVNKTSFQVQTKIDLYPNIAVSLLHSALDGYDLSTTDGYNQVSSSSINFSTEGVLPGYVIRINEPGFDISNIILAVNGHNLVLNDNMPANYVGDGYFSIYSNVEEEIPGVRAIHPAYQLSRDGYCNNILTIIDRAQVNDIVLIRTLGLNNRRINRKYYVWGNTSNIIKTMLPSPILLCDVNINHILLNYTSIGPTNSTLTSGIFIFDGYTDQPSVSDTGRTLSVYISGDNIDYTTSITVAIHGTIGGVSGSTNVLTFTENSTQITTSKFETVDFVQVNCKPLDSTKNSAVILVKETYPITHAENSNTAPIIRYSYQMSVGNSLSGSGSVVTDLNNSFSAENINNYLVIYSPSSVAGQYLIESVSTDFNSLNLSTTLPASFTDDGVYEILNVSTFRSGLQNGFFTFENTADGYLGQPYKLNQGLYEFDYNSNISIPIDASTLKGYIGTDLNGSNTANCVIDDFQIVSEKLTDTRVGETIATNQQGITKNFNSLKASIPTNNTLMLLHFDNYPFTNDSNFYVTASDQFIQSSVSVNENFGKSIAFTKKSLLVDNKGILNSKQQGTIEFWVNPLFDAGNDPNYRFYFDATGMVSEKVISSNNATVKVSGKISSILNVKAQVGDQNIDYFAGGRIDSDMQTIFLNRPLSSQQTPVIVNYIPNGTNGDRISIYKDPSGYVNFDVKASGIDYQVRAPVFWTKGSWHRLKASYTVNSGLGTDGLRFFVDGYEQGNVLFGSGLLFGQSQVFGSSFVGENKIKSSIVFKDTINEFFIGGDYTGVYGAYALIDNLRISNISRPIFKPFGESMDVNYTPNIDIALPVTPDLYTTLLLDFETLITKNTNFSTLKNKDTGNFDFTVNIFDSFDIVSENPKVKTVLNTLIETLKPANSRVFINYE